MDKVDENSRLDQIPILHARGTHRVVGFTVGRQFRTMIEDVLLRSKFFNEYVLPGYETEQGKEIYEKSLGICNQRFPQYVEELEGMAAGAKIPFYKLFLLNLDFSLASPDVLSTTNKGESGCSSVMSNSGNPLIGHTEDAFPELLNNVFILSAEILTDKGQRLEKFTTMTYAGSLPGYTMGFNEHGFIYTVNTLYPLKTCPRKTPRSFIARGILTAKTLDQVLFIARDKGSGISDAFSINMHFAKEEGALKLYNVEICPDPDSDESIVNLLTLNNGDSYAHCNKFLRHSVPELPRAFMSSVHRHRAIEKHPSPDNVATVLDILSDQTDSCYPVFRYGLKEPDLISTVAVGVFDIRNRTWSVYIQPPNKNKPIAIIPLEF